MKYRVHRLEVNKDDFQAQLAQFCNTLDGEVVAIVPNVTRYFLCYGVKIDFVLIVERSTF
jgi:hypothetical protein